MPFEQEQGAVHSHTPIPVHTDMDTPTYLC